MVLDEVYVASGRCPECGLLLEVCNELSLILNGLTPETRDLSRKERIELWEVAVAHAGGRVHNLFG